MQAEDVFPDEVDAIEVERAHVVARRRPGVERREAPLEVRLAVVAVGLCLVILALLAHTSRPGAAHHPRPAGHACSVC